jgi:hypothetical protein
LCLLLGCGRENALVGGECAAGYVQDDDTCVLAGDAGLDGGVDGDATIPDDGSDDGAPRDVTHPDAPDDSPSDAPSDVIVDAFTCDDGLTLCSATCVDTTSDPFNCGACGIVCPSLLCSNSKCQGGVPGSFVVIGHDYGTSYSAAQARVLGNALLLATASTIRVRSYEEYAAGGAVTNVKAILNAAAAGAGRTLSYTVATQPTDVTPGMSAANTDVLVIYDQSSAPAGTLAGIGSGWVTTIANFTHVGGVVIALDGAGGSDPQMPALIQSAGILDVASDAPIAQSTPLDVVAPADAVGLGVVSPYGAGKKSVYFACNEANGGAVTYVVEDPAGDAGPTQPVVVHKVAP